MDRLIQKSAFLAAKVSTQFTRKLQERIDWNDRLIGITGARGVGKTTLMLQVLKAQYGITPAALYVTADDVYFTENGLFDTIERFHQLGGRVVFIDEIHKYPGWAREIKNLYDTYETLKLVFSGSSIIDLMKEQVDLSRRALLYNLNGLSFREYLSLTGVVHAAPLSLTDILTRHVAIAAEIRNAMQPLPHFKTYLKAGYYPFFAENPNTYGIRLEQMVRLITEVDLQFIDGFNPHNTRKMQQLLLVLAESVPFKPNIAKLAERMAINRNTLVQYLHFMEQAKLIHLLFDDTHGISRLQKPEKLFVENTNIVYALAGNDVNPGTIRETFLMNSLKNHAATVTLPKQGDFLVNGTVTLEVGGKQKSRKQIAENPDAFIAADDLEIGAFNKIPLWLFGFLD